MAPGVEWPNLREGITIRGHAAVRDYWTKQFQLTRSKVEPEEFIEAGRRLIVVVHQVVRDLAGELLADHRVAHVYTFTDSKIARMDVYGDRDEALDAVGLPEQDAARADSIAPRPSKPRG
jgi:ketosteroid isomerase-like protein